MANFKRNSTEASKPRKIRVNHVRIWEDKNISFDLTVEDVTIYGCRLVQARKDGESDFVGFPSRKAKDGKYYSYAYTRISEEELQIICDQIADALNND